MAKGSAKLTKADLTPEQLRLVELREDEGLSWKELERKLGVKLETLRSRYETLRSKMAGVRPRFRHPNKIDREIPELVTADADKRKAQTIKGLTQALARVAGISVPAAKRMAARVVRGEMPDFKPEDFTTKQFQGLVKVLILRLFSYMDDFTMSQMSGKDLMASVGVAFNMHQLMAGEPTSHMRVEDRRTLNELLPAILKEAQRRGQIIDVTPIEEGPNNGAQ